MQNLEVNMCFAQLETNQKLLQMQQVQIMQQQQIQQKQEEQR